MCAPVIVDYRVVVSPCRRSVMRQRTVHTGLPYDVRACSLSCRRYGIRACVSCVYCACRLPRRWQRGAVYAYAHSSSCIVRACERYVDSCSSATGGTKNAEHAPVVPNSEIHYVVLPDRTLYEICAVFVILCGTRVSRHPCRVHASAGGDTRPPRKHPSVRTPRGKAASSLHLSFSLFAPSLSLSSSLPYSQLHACGIAVRVADVYVHVVRCICMYLWCTDTRDKRVVAAARLSRVCVRAVRSVLAVSYFYPHTHTRIQCVRCVRAVRATGIRKTHAKSFQAIPILVDTN